jgi:DNA-binding XRE family transcriptional regulator
VKIDARIRNVDVDLTRSVSELHPEAVETILDRGSLSDWRLLAAEIGRQPWGRLVRTVEEIVSWNEHDGVDRVMSHVIGRARGRIDAEARAQYAAQIRRWRRQANLTLRQLAELAGTSESRLSAYENGRVAPTTTVLGRIERSAARAH